ncbi:MAG TPA: RecQ family ATP-dependent DNA helicase [Acidimicrobiales bacterium]|jgi:ATP-dependent DNA helicase RecQ|nr:RecQ family ATP-dependent DNA helicase [Acidimicrobiales bacterium]
MPPTHCSFEEATTRLGFETLRPGQEESIRALLAGHDVLSVLPTGAGKSAIYQMAGMMLGAPTIVVSPLIALQKDQVDGLAVTDAGGAVQLNSLQSPSVQTEALESFVAGRIRFLFLAPEQMAHEQTVDRLRHAKVGLFVVDEAHCISAWGHDFRPDYLQLPSVIPRLGRPQVVALTATAAPPVRQEIVERLQLRRPTVVVRGFDRPNLELTVQRYVSDDDKVSALYEHAARAPGQGIVYVATRRAAEEGAERLNEAGVAAIAYHGAMARGRRDEAQEQFMSGAARVIVATPAFGMGIDKPDIRFVFHQDVSESLDAYYQEIGRAGRDGEMARATLYYRPADMGLRRFFASGGRPDPDRLLAALEAVDDEAVTDIATLAERLDTSAHGLQILLSWLVDVGAVELGTGGTVRRVPAVDVHGALEEAAQLAERHRDLEQSRVEMMRDYAETRGCRRERLLGYFGEPYHPPCHHCDNCRRGTTEVPAHGRYPTGAQVRHRAWGAGQVVRSSPEELTVLFDDKGYRTLSVALVEEGDLLECVDSGDSAAVPEAGEASAAD